ncbi:MAG: NADH-quinone oxidoreductase subunit N [Pirellulaceae bacterium]
MNLHEIVSQLIIDTKGEGAGLFSAPAPGSSIALFYPELLLCATIVLMLLVRVFDAKQRINAFYIALAGALAALVMARPWDLLATEPVIERVEIFTGLLVFDGLTVFMRSVLALFVVLFLVMTRLTGLPDREDGPDIYSLVFGATLGMMLMASANHLLTVFLAVEMASVPSYVLAGMLKGRKVGSEAALKYSVYGAGAAGVMLYGISLVAGMLNTVHLPTIAHQLVERWPTFAGEEIMALALGGLMIAVGLAFKLSAVPFHFWCPDVFEGASSEVNAFLSVASKAGALALLIRVALGFGTLAPATEVATVADARDASSSAAVVVAADEVSQVRFVAEVVEESAEEPLAIGDGLGPVRGFIAKLVAFFAVVTCTFGNFAAYGQRNIKRLLAYSTIAHAGYMMMAVPPIMALAELDPVGARAAVGSLAIYIFVYLFMNLGAFAVVAFLRNSMRSEDIDHYSGLIRKAPVLTVCFALMLFSLIGLPPLAGFIGKLAIFASLTEAYRETGQTYLVVLLVAGGINTAISLVYYMRVVKVMTIDGEPESRLPFQVGLLPVAYTVLLTIPVVGTIVSWDKVNQLALAAAANLLG